MTLAEKIKHLREIEGELRGLGRAMTQMEVVDAMRDELGGKKISQAYLSQLESGKRRHLTAESRDLLARFFKVHPGYLVSDPENYSTDLLTDVESDTDQLAIWQEPGQSDGSEPALFELRQRLGELEQPERYLQLFYKLTDLPLEDLQIIVEAVINSKQHSPKG